MIWSTAPKASGASVAWNYWVVLTFVGEKVAREFPALAAQTGRVDVFTTLDLNLQRAAIDAAAAEIAQIAQAQSSAVGELSGRLN